jgi:hypothetical protein
VPLLDSVLTAEDLVEAYARDDSRILWHDQVHAAVVAALVVLGDVQRAREVADLTFRGAALSILFPKVAALLTD